MFGLGKYVRLYKTFRKWKWLMPIYELSSKENAMGKIKSRKLWYTALTALIISVLSQMGMEADTLDMVSTKLLYLAGIYIGGNATVHMADAIGAKKK